MVFYGKGKRREKMISVQEYDVSKFEDDRIDEINYGFERIRKIKIISARENMNSAVSEIEKITGIKLNECMLSI